MTKAPLDARVAIPLLSGAYATLGALRRGDHGELPGEAAEALSRALGAIREATAALTLACPDEQLSSLISVLEAGAVVEDETMDDMSPEDRASLEAVLDAGFADHREGRIVEGEELETRLRRLFAPK